MILYHERSLESTYKNLVVSGCSFTHNEHHTPVTWANTLAYWTGMSIRNHAINGAGNSHIAMSLILDLEKTQPDPSTTLILVMWSSLGRVDFISDRRSFEVMPRFYYEYDNFNQLAQLRRLKGLQKNYISLQSDHSYVLKYWLNVQILTTYLKCRGYRLFYTSIFDLTDSIWGDIETKLREIDLTFDKSNWLLFPRENYLGSWVKARGLVAADGWHPTPESQESWTREVLVPKLQELGIINE